MNTQQIIETAEEKLIHTYNRYQIVLDKGDGVRLYDTDGKEYLDFGAGIAVFALGYNNKFKIRLIITIIKPYINCYGSIKIKSLRSLCPVIFITTACKDCQHGNNQHHTDKSS